MGHPAEPRSDHELPGFCRALGLPGMVDVHVHFMPERLLHKVWASFDRVPPAFGVDWPIRYRHDEQTRIGTLRRLGVLAHTALVYPHKPGMAPGPIGAVLARHPRLTLVVAHCGSPEYAEFLDLAAGYPNVYLDTTMVFTDFSERRTPFPAALLPRLRDLGDRVVLGSDYPNIPYPYAHQVAVLARLGLGDDWLRAVLHHNGARLLAPLVPRPRRL
jgi:predicted TIM-barrel fold metal-dependent hydrolase